MKSHLYHAQLNIDFANAAFYRDLMRFLGWSPMLEEDDALGYKSEKTGDLWFIKSKKNEREDYDKIGVNHLSLRVENQNDVDEAMKFLEIRDIKALFETPRHRPEFAEAEDKTYYQVMFKSPDGILFEVVYIGLKA